MSKKIIFFDVDGTLVDVRAVKECIPESTIQAVHETRKKGNLCWGFFLYKRYDFWKFPTSYIK